MDLGKDLLGKDLQAVGRELLAPVRDLGGYIRDQRTAAKISLRALADKAGVSNPYLSQIERGLRKPSAAILTQIADGLSISAESLLVKAGVLRETDITPVVTAIRADPDLDERQKASLVEIYRAFTGSGRPDDRAPGAGLEADREAPPPTESTDDQHDDDRNTAHKLSTAHKASTDDDRSNANKRSTANKRNNHRE